jgi:TetR/AcrR family transcriptional repressor of nem operon
MARPREFDFDRAVDRGMHVFWQRGYEATSLGDLLNATSLSKSSFYQAFRSKHDFLVTALDHYVETILRPLIDDLASGSARAAIMRSLERVISRSASPRGCLIHNCAVELAHRDAVVRRAAARALRRLEDAYRAAIERGQLAGELSPAIDARAVARYLVAGLNGLHVLARVEPDPRALRPVIDVIASALT